MFEDSKFMNGISFEENPYADETPDATSYFDQNGNEVIIDGN